MADRTVSVALQLKLAQFTSGLRQAQQQTKKFGDDLSSQAKKNKGDWDKVGNSLGGFGLAAAGGLGLAVAKFAQFDKAMSGVKAATQETTANMNLLRAAAVQAGKDTAFSATEAAQGIEALAKAGVSTKDILGGGLKGALDLAAAGQIDVATAAETAATAMTQFGLSGAQVPHIADLLAAGAGKAQGEVTDMAGALKQSGLVAAQFGLSVEESTGTLAAFASAGLIGSDAGTSFKTMLLQLANPSKQSAAAMKELGINAYDAKGAFIGIAPLAEQLKTKMSGLSEEQRNAALATIFGTDAIRAANVLYTQGAQGISEWTTKVNDAGFAAQQARDKTDNLSGDVERLGGAFDTALIQSGSGANSVLRGLVQAADGAVSAFADLPPAVTGTATALTAVATVGGLGAAGTLKAASAAGELKAAWTGLGRVGRTLTLSMGAVGVVLVAAGLAYSAFAKKNEEAKHQVDDLKSTLDEATGAITANTRAYVANELAQSGLAEKAKAMGLNLSTVTDAALGNKSAMSQLVTQLDAIAAANSFLIDPRIGTQYTDQGQAALDLKNKLTGLNGSLGDAQQKQRLAAEGATEHKDAQTLQAEAIAKANEKIKTQTQDLESLISTMLKMPGQVLSLRDAQRAVEAAFDDASDSIKENGRTLDITTPKGRANQAALDAMAKSANDLAESQMRSGKSNVAVSDTLAANRAQLIATARRMGMNEAQAKTYAASVLVIPKKVTTEAVLKADKADLDTKLAAARKALADPKLTATKRAKLEAEIAKLLAAKRQAQAAIDSLTGKTVTIAANVKLNVANVRAKVDAQLARAGVGQADGGYYPDGVPTYADGKLPSQAMVAPGKGRGLVRWAEEETGGEAFIPLAPSKRQRSTEILGQVADSFGLGLVRSFADGAFLPAGPSFVGGPEPVGHDVVRKSDLAGMIGALTITNWDKGTGHFQLIARGEVAAAGEFAGTMTRMGG